MSVTLVPRIEVRGVLECDDLSSLWISKSAALGAFIASPEAFEKESGDESPHSK